MHKQRRIQRVRKPLIKVNIAVVILAEVLYFIKKGGEKGIIFASNYSISGERKLINREAKIKQVFYFRCTWS